MSFESFLCNYLFHSKQYCCFLPSVVQIFISGHEKSHEHHEICIWHVMYPTLLNWQFFLFFLYVLVSSDLTQQLPAREDEDLHASPETCEASQAHLFTSFQTAAQTASPGSVNTLWAKCLQPPSYVHKCTQLASVTVIDRGQMICHLSHKESLANFAPLALSGFRLDVQMMCCYSGACGRIMDNPMGNVCAFSIITIL